VSTKKKDKTPALLKFIRWLFPKLERFAPSLAHQYFIKIFFTPLRYPIPDKEKAMIATSERFEVTVENKRVQCYRWGKGPIVLLVHGWAGRTSQFRKFVPQLVLEGFTVIGFDAPAHGNSEGRKTNINEFETAIKKIYEQVGQPEAIICHSFGGGAVMYSAVNGLPVKKLIMIASPSVGDEIIATYLRAINGSWSTGNFFKNYILKRYGKPFEQFTSQYFSQHLKQEIELLLVYDEDDKEVKPLHAYEIKKNYPKAELMITKGLGHTRILKDDAVISNCVTFMRK
jgi:pimeloyl-ACP methyl ester carboxylesterase